MLESARSSQHWQAGGIIQRVEWQTAPGHVRLWDGTETTVEPGDVVLVFWRGLPAVDLVGVEKGAEA